MTPFPLLAAAVLAAMPLATLAAQGPRAVTFASAVTDDVGLPGGGTPRLARIPDRCLSSPPGHLAIGGILGGAIGMFGGAYGLAAVTDGSAEDGDMAAAIIGGGLGEITGVAAGVHLANGGRGNALADFVASGLGLMAGMFLSAHLDHVPHNWVAVPMVQVPVVVAIERLTARNKAARIPACRPI